MKKRIGILGATLGVTAAGVATATLAPTPASACGDQVCSCQRSSPMCLNGAWFVEICCTEGAGWTCRQEQIGSCEC